MLKYLKLEGVGPAPEMEIEFAPRLNVITGDNGLGKSFLLDIAWFVFTGTWSGLPARPNASGKRPWIACGFAENYKFTRQYVLGEWESTTDFEKKSLVVYAKVDGGFCVRDPLRNHPHIPGISVGEAFLFEPVEIWNGLTMAGKRGYPERFVCKGLVEDWAGWQKENSDPFRQICRILEILSPSEDEVLKPGKLTRISLSDVRDVPSLKMPYGQEVPVLLVSAAIKRILSLAYLLVWTWQEHQIAAEFLRLPKPTGAKVLFLIDEIESHLHPKWQRRILRALLEVMSSLLESDRVEVQIIATTHSPLILASLEPLFDAEQDALFDLDLVHRGEGQAPEVEIRRLPWRKRGEAGNWLTSEAFGLKSSRSLEAEALLEKANTAMNAPGFDTTEARKLDAELRQTLSDTDPFWLRWRFVGEQKGWLK
jgi:hypothetical protein